MRSGRIRASAVTALLGVAAVIGGATALAAPAPGTVRVLKMVEREIPNGGGFFDAPPAATGEDDVSVGDFFSFTSHLFSPKGKRIGRDQGYCLFIDKSGLAQCEATLILAGGTILIKQGLALASGAPTFTVAVIGGTGAFEGVRGSTQITERRTRGPGVSDFVVRLIY